MQLQRSKVWLKINTKVGALIIIESGAYAGLLNTP
jgi:hypothetical protein